MPDKCVYCGREANPETGIPIYTCPVCQGLFCPPCGCEVTFFEQVGDPKDETYAAYMDHICKAHLPWSIIEGIKRGKDGR